MQLLKIKSGSKLKWKIDLLNGDEVSKELMIWLKDLEDKILKNFVLTAPAKLAILQRLVNMEAQSIASKVESDCKGYIDPEDVSQLQDYRIREYI